MTREEAINWLKVINTKEFGWDEFALQESQREIRERCEQGVREAIDMAIEALSVANLKEEFESADATPTVIRAKTFMRKEDFDKWAEDIKKQNKSIVCIPCDAEVVSAVQGEWIPCSEKLPSESDDYICTIPLDADETYTEVLTFHKGRFYEDDDEWGATYHDDVLAWMPLPKPYGEKRK